MFGNDAHAVTHECGNITGGTVNRCVGQDCLGTGEDRWQLNKVRTPDPVFHVQRMSVDRSRERWLKYSDRRYNMSELNRSAQGHVQIAFLSGATYAAMTCCHKRDCSDIGPSSDFEDWLFKPQPRQFPLYIVHI